jgi:hypothetical protein
VEQERMATVVLLGQTLGDSLGPAALEFARSVGVPALIAIIVLTQLQPKIDRGIAIADHVDAELNYLALRGCAPLNVGDFPT